tara:strand:+ start:511 stop:777 length:267 start_codon:yes stop_codon:yes gene_type:complete
MSLTYAIDKFEIDGEDATKTLIGFRITDANGDIFIIDKKVTTGSNSDEQLVTAAQSAAQSEIDAWVASRANVGKIWNPDTNSFQEETE